MTNHRRLTAGIDRKEPPMSATTTKHLRTTLIVLIAVLAFVTTYQVAEAADRNTQTAGEPAVLPDARRILPRMRMLR